MYIHTILPLLQRQYTFEKQQNRPILVNIVEYLVNEKEFLLLPHIANLASYNELCDGWFVNVGCVVLGNIIIMP